MEAPPKHPKTARLFSQLLAALDISASKLATALSQPGEDYKQQTISNYVNGKFQPGQEVLAAILRKYPAVNKEWLLTGEGEPFPNGRYNEKAAPATQSNVSAEPEKPEPPRPAGASGMKVHRPTYEELLSENASLHQRLGEKDDVITDLRADKGNLWQQLQRKKTDASPDAADPTNMAISFVNPDRLAAQEFLRRRPAFPAPAVSHSRLVVVGLGRQTA